MEVKINDWFLVNKDCDIKGYAEIALKKEYPIQLYSIERNSDYYYFQTKGVMELNGATNAFGLKGLSFVKKITLEEKEKLLKKINKEGLKKSKENSKLLITKRVKASERKVENLITKDLLLTNVNFANLVQKTNHNNVKESQMYVGCCSFSKTSSYDIMIYVPKTWLNYFGYNLFDLKAYLDFLKKCKIGFEAEILGLENLKDVYSIKQKHTFLTKTRNNFYLNKEEKVYKILLKGNSNYSFITYFHFILVRYLYNHYYWNLPFLMLKLKKNMPKVSYFDCLLLAHNFEGYNGGYSLTQGCSNEVLLPRKNFTKESILESLKRVSSSFNSVFYKTRLNRIDLANLIKEENYKELENIINNNKNN